VTDRPWPDARHLVALARLLCRPAPPLVAAARLESSGGLEPIAATLGASADRALVARVQANLREFQRAGGSILTYWDAAYPPLLRHIARPPVVLFVRGDPAVLARPAVALVGARAATLGARTWTHDVAADLARCGLVIASGLARGIDAAAHQGALAAGGATVAVLGCGPDICYPPEHAPLAARVVASGCLVTEFPPGTPPRAWHFPMRNRILAGLVSGVVVVQAEPKSGALVTARHALDENRQLMAVPGEIADPRSRGPHALLRDGAALVEDAGDILRNLGLEPAAAGAGRGPETDAVLGGDLGALWRALGKSAEIETLRARLGWSAERLLRVLAELELAGLVRRQPGGTVCRTSRRC